MPSVDNRVVQMRFDNKDFEEDIGTSIKSLDKLKKSLNFDDEVDGFEKLGKAADVLVQKLDPLGVIADQVLRNIGNEIMGLKNKFVSLVKSMSIDQVSAGWEKYATKTTAVQTIMSATADQFNDTAVQMEFVNNQLERLNWFTDETSFNLVDMVSNIGKFTNNGQKLDVAVTAMEGIATWAGISGANVQQASHAMYNLSQALSTGAVTLIDWKSIENANMSTVEFKQTVIDTAVALGTLKKASNDTYKTLAGHEVTLENFNKNLADRWFTSDVLMKALNKYGGFVDILSEEMNKVWDSGGNLTTSKMIQYIDEYKKGTIDLNKASYETGIAINDLQKDLQKLASDEYELGRRAFAASQEAKTFQEAIDSVKDAVSSGWMNTFEHIFGDYEKAKKLWTTLANELWDVFASGAEARNTLFDQWIDYGGYDKLWDSISNLWEGLKSIGKKISNVWKRVFPSWNIDKMMAFTHRLYLFSEEFRQAFEIIEDTIESVVNTLFNLFDDKLDSTVFDSVTQGVYMVQSMANVTRDWVDDLKDVIDGFRSAISLVAEALKTLAKYVGIPALKGLGELFKKILAFFAPLARIFTNFVSKVKANKAITKIAEDIKSWVQSLKEALLQRESVKVFLGYLSDFKNWINGIKTKALKRIEDFLDYISNGRIKLPDVNSIADFIDKALVYVNKLLNLLKSIGPFLEKLYKFVTSLDFSGVKEFATSAAEAVSTFLRTLLSDEELNKAGKSWVSSLWEGIKQGVKELDTKEVVSTLFRALELIPIFSIATSFSAFMFKLTRLISWSADAVWALEKAFRGLGRMFNGVAFLMISSGLLVLAAAMLVMSKIPYGRLADISASISIVLLSLAVVFSTIDRKNLLGQIFKVVAIITALGFVLIALGSAVKNVGATKHWDKVLLGLIGTFAALMAVLLAFVSLVSNTDIWKMNQTVTYSFFMGIVAFAASLRMLIPFFLVLNQIAEQGNTRDVALVFLEIAGMMLVYSAAMSLIASEANMSDLSSVKTLFSSMLVSMDSLIPLLLVLNKIANDGNLEDILKTTKKLIRHVGMLMILMLAINAVLSLKLKGEANYRELTLNILSMAAVFVALAVLIRSLNGTTSENISNLKKIFGMFSLMLVALSVISMFVGAIPVLSAGLKLLGILLPLFGLGLLLAGKGILFFAKAMKILQDSMINSREIGKKLGEGVVGFFESLNEGADEILKFVDRVWGLIITAIIAKKANLTSLGAMLLKSFATSLVSSKWLLIAAIAVLIAGVLEYFGINIDPIVDALVEIIVLIVSALAKSLIDNADVIIESFYAIAKALIYILSKALVQLEDFWRNSLIGKIFRVIELIVNPAQLNYAISTGDWWGTEQAERDMAFVEEYGEEAERIAEDAGRKARKRFNNALAEATEGTGIEFNTKDATDINSEESEEEAVEAADNIFNGFINEIKANKKNLWGAGEEDIAEPIIGGTEEGLGEHSPSKVFARIGRFLVLGFVQGIRSSSFMASDAADNMADDTINSFSTVISDISDAINSDFDLDPTIRPVLDLSEIQNGSSRLNSIWGGYSFSPDMSFGLDRARSVTAAAADINMNQTSLSEAMMLMQADIAMMKEDNASMIAMMDRYMPYIPEIANMEVDLDSDTLVGKLAPKMDKELGNIASSKRRGRF